MNSFANILLFGHAGTALHVVLYFVGIATPLLVYLLYLYSKNEERLYTEVEAVGVRALNTDQVQWVSGHENRDGVHRFGVCVARGVPHQRVRIFGIPVGARMLNHTIVVWSTLLAPAKVGDIRIFTLYDFISILRMGGVDEYPLEGMDKEARERLGGLTEDAADSVSQNRPAPGAIADLKHHHA